MKLWVITKPGLEKVWALRIKKGCVSVLTQPLTFLIKEIERILVNNGDMVVAKYIQFQLVHDVLNS